MQDWHLSGYLILRLLRDQGAHVEVDDTLELTINEKQSSLRRWDGCACFNGVIDANGSIIGHW